MFSSKVSKHELDNPDTLAKGPDDDLNHDEYAGVEEDIFGQHPVSDVTEETDSIMIFHEDIIENIFKAVKENAVNSPSILMVADKDDSKGSKAAQVDVLFPPRHRWRAVDPLFLTSHLPRPLVQNNSVIILSLCKILHLFRIMFCLFSGRKNLRISNSSILSIICIMHKHCCYYALHVMHNT